MNAKPIAYWTLTALIAFAMLAGGIGDVMLIEPMREAMEHLGYPLYFAQILGVWKILGAVALVSPGFERVKEWAYAGIFFNLTGAVFSHIAAGDALAMSAPPLFLTGLLVGSYLLLQHRSEPAFASQTPVAA